MFWYKIQNSNPKNLFIIFNQNMLSFPAKTTEITKKEEQNIDNNFDKECI